MVYNFIFYIFIRTMTKKTYLAMFSLALQTVCKADIASQKLQSLCSELGCPENMVQQWVNDVRQWATDGTVLHDTSKSGHGFNMIYSAEELSSNMLGLNKQMLMKALINRIRCV